MCLTRRVSHRTPQSMPYFQSMLQIFLFQILLRGLHVFGVLLVRTLPFIRQPRRKRNPLVKCPRTCKLEVVLLHMPETLRYFLKVENNFFLPKPTAELSGRC
ncbi:unnamed protein product [Ectocarpus sp. 4 AP-2014]